MAKQAAAANAASGKPLFTFTSHIDGKNARVQIWPDRIEWERKAVSGGKVAAGILTLGVSTVFTGVRGKNTDMVPIRQVGSITTKKGAGFNTVVRVGTAAGVVEFRANHGEAEKAKVLVQRLMLEASQPTQVVVQAAAAPIPVTTDSIPDQLQKLASLRDAGILTEEEFTAKKTELLARM